MSEKVKESKIYQLIMLSDCSTQHCKFKGISKEDPKRRNQVQITKRNNYFKNTYIPSD